MTCHKPLGLMISASLLGVLVIVFVVLGFATDHWVDTDVDRSKLDSDDIAMSIKNTRFARTYYTRHKGIIRECYPEDDSDEFLKKASNVVNNDCFYINFDDPEDTSMSSDYDMRMHLMRGVLATYVLGLVGVILAFVLGMVLCFAKNYHVAYIAAICTFIAAMFIMTAIVLFHAQEYVEANSDGKHGEEVFQNNWTENLLKATDSEFGYSYPLAWVGFILAVLDGVLYMLASRALHLQYVIYDDGGSTFSSSSSDRRPVIKKKSGEVEEFYDNLGMKYAAFPAAALGATMPAAFPADALGATMPAAYPVEALGATVPAGMPNQLYDLPPSGAALPTMRPVYFGESKRKSRRSKS